MAKKTKKRSRKKNPKKRAAHKRPAHRAASHRAQKKNPSRRRRHRRNPGGPMVQAGIAAAAGIGAFVVIHLVNQFVNKSYDTTIRRGIAAAGLVGGLVLAKDKPMIGAAVAGGAAVALAGSELTAGAIKAIVANKSAPPSTAGLGEVVAYPQLAAVVPDMGDMGAIVPEAPWSYPSPL